MMPRIVSRPPPWHLALKLHQNHSCNSTFYRLYIELISLSNTRGFVRHMQWFLKLKTGIIVASAVDKTIRRCISCEWSKFQQASEVKRLIKCSICTCNKVNVYWPTCVFTLVLAVSSISNTVYIRCEALPVILLCFATTAIVALRLLQANIVRSRNSCCWC